MMESRKRTSFPGTKTMSKLELPIGAALVIIWFVTDVIHHFAAWLAGTG